MRHCRFHPSHDPQQKDSSSGQPTRSSKDSTNRPEGHIKRRTIKSNPPEGQVRPRLTPPSGHANDSMSLKNNACGGSAP